MAFPPLDEPVLYGATVTVGKSAGMVISMTV
jgi:hypothetical protein